MARAEAARARRRPRPRSPRRGVEPDPLDELALDALVVPRPTRFRRPGPRARRSCRPRARRAWCSGRPVRRLHRQPVALDSRSRGGEVRFARGAALLGRSLVRVRRGLSAMTRACVRGCARRARGVLPLESTADSRGAAVCGASSRRSAAAWRPPLEPDRPSLPSRFRRRFLPLSRGSLRRPAGRPLTVRASLRRSAGRASPAAGPRVTLLSLGHVDLVTAPLVLKPRLSWLGGLQVAAARDRGLDDPLARRWRCGSRSSGCPTRVPRRGWRRRSHRWRTPST